MNLDRCPGCGKFVRWGVSLCRDCVGRREAAEARLERIMRTPTTPCPYPWGACICGDSDHKAVQP